MSGWGYTRDTDRSVRRLSTGGLPVLREVEGVINVGVDGDGDDRSPTHPPRPSGPMGVIVLGGDEDTLSSRSPGTRGLNGRR